MKRLNGWLEISTDGFAQRQEDRPPAHLLKELIQNALDAVIGVALPQIDVYLLTTNGKVRLIVQDNGPGVEDLTALRTVFWSGKEDSFLLRGRMGQGFKEILCLAESATVASRDWQAIFYVKNGKRLCDVGKNKTVGFGTQVIMDMPWGKKEIPRLVDYLETFLIPENVTLNVSVDGPLAYQSKYRDPAHVIANVPLRTETFAGGRWIRKKEQGTIHLVPLIDGVDGSEAMVYEMGIPVCSAEWPQPFHIDVQMRVPMNPRRDAVASGYLKEVYSACLPVLMKTLEAQQLRDEWVSQAVTEVTPELQKEVVTRAFGVNAVRSVPTMGTRHDFDSDAKELGYEPLKTQYLPSGLRSVAEEYLPTSRDIELERRSAIEVALGSGEVREKGNDARVKSFCMWLGQQILGIPIDVRIVDKLSTSLGTAFMAWSPGGRLALNADYRSQWANIMRPSNIGVLVHEMSHERASHHGDEFRKEVERLAGEVALVFLNKAEEIREKFGDLLAKN